MSERDPNCKRAARDPEAPSASISPLKKKKKLDDDSHGVVVAVAAPSPSSADSSQGGCSVITAGEGEDDGAESSIICLSSESYEIGRSSPTAVSVNLQEEAHQISETETSPVSEETTETESQKPPEVSKIPTPGEIEEFLSELEDKDQKRFIEKYNFDIVNDKPLQGRYKWDRF